MFWLRAVYECQLCVLQCGAWVAGWVAVCLKECRPVLLALPDVLFEDKVGSVCCSADCGWQGVAECVLQGVVVCAVLLDVLIEDSV